MKVLAAILLLFIVIPARGGAEEPIKSGPVATAAWLKSTPTVQIVDVRTKEEFAGGHIAKARLIPWTDKDFATRVVKELDPAQPVLVYCQSGGRSAKAAAALAKLGFKRIRDLDGGMLEWRKSSNPIVKPE